jgi:hypothetical protein
MSPARTRLVTPRAVWRRLAQVLRRVRSSRLKPRVCSRRHRPRHHTGRLLHHAPRRQPTARLHSAALLPTPHASQSSMAVLLIAKVAPSSSSLRFLPPPVHSCVGSIVSLISLPSCPPINPPLQAIVTEVDAHGHVQSLELAVLRAFDSTSPAIELVAESGPTPLKKSLSARTGLKDALSPSKDPSPLTPSKDPSPVASDSPAAQPLPGTLRIKLQSFAPYAALFKVSPFSNNNNLLTSSIQAKSSSNLSKYPTHNNLRNRSLVSDRLLYPSTFFRAAATTSRDRS